MNTEREWLIAFPMWWFAAPIFTILLVVDALFINPQNYNNPTIHSQEELDWIEYANEKYPKGWYSEEATAYYNEKYPRGWYSEEQD